MRIETRTLPTKAGKHVLMPRRFTAIEETEDGLKFTAEIEADGKNPPRCTRLTVEPVSDQARIGSTVFRRHSVTDFVGRAIASAALPVEFERVEGGWKVSPLTEVEDGIAEEIWEAIREPHRGSPIKDEHLEAVGEVYREARARGQKPPAVIASKLHASQATAYRWIKAAKAAGYIKE